MQDVGGELNAGRNKPPMIAICHGRTDRLGELIALVHAAGYRAQPLPPPATGLCPWLDMPFDLLLLSPFFGWQDPAQLMAIARTLSGRRPILAVSDRDALADRMLALEGGADDAIGWTDNSAEVIARIGGLIRRSHLAAGRICCDELAIDLVDRRVIRAGKSIRMPLREFDLLANLARVPNRTISRGSLLRAVWRIDFDPGTNRVEVHMSRLRSKIDRGFAWPMLMTIKGEGYALRSHRGACL